MVIVRQAQEQRVPHVAADIAGTGRDRTHPRPTHHLIRPRLMAGVVAVAAVHPAAQKEKGTDLFSRRKYEGNPAQLKPKAERVTLTPFSTTPTQLNTFTSPPNPKKQKSPRSHDLGLFHSTSGAPGGIRTHDPCLRSPKSRRLESIR